MRGPGQRSELNIQSDVLVPKQRLGFLGTFGLGLGLYGDSPRVRANIQSYVLVPKQRLGFSAALGLGLGDFRFGCRACRVFGLGHSCMNGATNTPQECEGGGMSWYVVMGLGLCMPCPLYPHQSTSFVVRAKILCSIRSSTLIVLRRHTL